MEGKKKGLVKTILSKFVGCMLCVKSKALFYLLNLTTISTDRFNTKFLVELECTCSIAVA